jgi:glyoxylase-like metal-dependent hydrolase (beta-lactamase superfamily II)
MNTKQVPNHTNRMSNWAMALVVSIGLGCSTDGQSSAVKNESKDGLRVERYLSSEAGFLVTSNLIQGKKDAILVDAQFTRSDARNVVEMIKKSGKNLKTVFVTHGHPDHYFGAEILMKEFPLARFVASSDTVEDIKATGQAKLTYWKGIYKDNLTDVVPQFEVLKDSDLTLDGEKFELRTLLAGESEHATVLVVPSLKAAFVGDLAYDEVHLWLAEAANSTDSWKKNLANIEQDTKIETIYVGHQKVSRNNDKQVLRKNVDYINQALNIFGKAASPEAGAKNLKSLYPTYSLPVIADIAAGALVTAK